MPTLQSLETKFQSLMQNYVSISKYYDLLITTDTAIIKQKQFAAKLSTSNIPVLITGETGTGKELFARIIHSNRTGEFVAVNCAGIVETLLEAEFFGSVMGAYTSARDRAGYIEMAENGTLFLDEIGDMPLVLQCKLLRYLESGEFRRVGESKIRKSNARIIAATNVSDLGRSKKFRKDLYYRLNVGRINIKPLYKRPVEDIGLLIDKYLDPALLEVHKQIVYEELIFKIYKHPEIDNGEFRDGNVRSVINYLKVYNLENKL